MSAFKNRIQEKYGRLTVLSHAGKDKRGKHLWNCLCECGKQKLVVSDNLSSGKSNSCGCLKAEFLSRKGNQFGLYEDRRIAILKVQYSHLKRRHRKISDKSVIGFDLFKALSLDKCFYCGLRHSKELHDRTNETKKGKLLSYTVVECNGIDRLVSGEGYVEGNVCSCCKYCNMAKSTMGVVEFLNYIQRVYVYNYGSTGVACVNTNRNFIGIEMDDKYFDIAEKRIKEALPC